MSSSCFDEKGRVVGAVPAQQVGGGPRTAQADSPFFPTLSPRAAVIHVDQSTSAISSQHLAKVKCLTCLVFPRARSRPGSSSDGPESRAA